MEEWNDALKYSRVIDNSILLWLDGMGGYHYGDSPTSQNRIKTIIAGFDNGHDTFGQYQHKDGIIERT